MFAIQSGIAMPTTTRTVKGDRRLNAVKANLDAITEIGSSFLLPLASYTIAQEERRHYLNRVNKYGKEINKDFVVAGVDGIPAVPATEEHFAEDGETIIPTTEAIAAIPAGIRVWFAGYIDPALQAAKVVVPAEEQK